MITAMSQSGFSSNHSNIDRLLTDEEDCRHCRCSELGTDRRSRVRTPRTGAASSFATWQNDDIVFSNAKIFPPDTAHAQTLIEEQPFSFIDIIERIARRIIHSGANSGDRDLRK